MSSNEMFSRSGTTNPFGKCDEELKAKIPEQINEAFIGLALLSGSPKGEYLRDEIIGITHGRWALVTGKKANAKLTYDEVEQDFAALARLNGYTKDEYIKRLIISHTHGRVALLRMTENGDL